MATFSHHLDDASLEALFAMVDTRFASTLHAPWLDVGASEIWSETFAFASRLEARFLCLRSQWGDTPEQHLDFHVLSVAHERVPKGATLGADGALSNSSVIRAWEGEAGRLASLSILQHQERFGDEEVSYDKALLFESVTGARFALFADGIAGGLRFTTSARVLERLTDTTSLRALRRRNESGRGKIT